LTTAWGLIPLGVDESDVMMLLLSVFLLALLVIFLFIVLPWYYALLCTLLIVFSIYYGVRELGKEESEQGKKEM
jgi:hypothetical protein